MDCQSCMFHYGLNCLAVFGLRTKVISSLAYFPPTPPTYTFRSAEFWENVEPNPLEQSSERVVDVSNQGQQTLNMSYLNKAVEESSMRFHRVSSFITEVDPRPYKVNPNQTQAQLTHSSLKPVSSTEAVPKLRQPVSRKAYQVFLITRKQQAISLMSLEDISLKGYYLRTTQGAIIPCVHLQLTSLQSEYVLLHSHGNNADIGVLLDSYLDLTYNLGIDVVGYDYPGYGQSTGQPDDFGGIAAAESTYQFILRELGYDPTKVIIYGQSIGSGPSVMLAANPQILIGGLIIHSGFTSGVRVHCPEMSATNKYDLFPNIDYIQFVNCPVLIMHGTNDEQINDTQARSLANRTKNLFKLWLAEDGGHNNIEIDDKFREEYFQVLRAFVKHLKEINSGKNRQDVSKTHQASEWSAQQLRSHIYSRVYQGMQSQALTSQALDTTIININEDMLNHQSFTPRGSSKDVISRQKSTSMEVELSSHIDVSDVAPSDIDEQVRRKNSAFIYATPKNNINSRYSQQSEIVLKK